MNAIQSRRLLCGAVSMLLAGGACAGAFTTADTSGFFASPDNVSHPTGYNVSTGNLTSPTLNVCVVPGSPNAAAIDVSVANIVDTMNNLVPVPLNMKTGSNFTVDIDFESVALHELGHCIGLAHPNAASEAPSGTGDQRESTRAAPGLNGMLDYNPGGDGIHGSNDDLRGDDVNLHYFVPGDNDPFAVLGAVDSTNYSRDVADLPMGDTFPANADRQVAVLGRYGAATDDCAGQFFEPDSLCAEAVMQQGSPNEEFQRALAPDDVATLLYARSGIDRIAGTGDDYTPTLVYRGITSTNCDINVSFNDAETGFAVCAFGLSSAPPNLNDLQDALGYTSADMFFNTGSNWQFSSVRIPDPEPDTALVAPDTDTMIAASVLANDVNQEGSGDLRVTPASFGGPLHGTVAINADGTFTYTNTNATQTEDFFVYEVCLTDTTPGVDVTDACAYQVVSLTIDPEASELIHRSGFEAGEGP